MKADVDILCSYHFCIRKIITGLGDDKAYLIFCHERKAVFVHPGIMSYFHNKGIPPVSFFQKMIKLFGKIIIEFERRWQLHQHRSHHFFHGFKYVEETFKGLLRIVEFFHVCEVAAHLRTKEKVLRYSLRPVDDCILSRDAIKARVDLRSAKSLCIEFKPLCRRQLWRIVNAFPVLVTPARCADMNTSFHL